LGLLVTRTLAPRAVCPPPGNPAPIEPNDDLSVLIDETERFLDAGGRFTDLEKELTDALQAAVSSEFPPSLSVTYIDITGDGVGEAVIGFELVHPSLGRHNALAILGCQAGSVRILLSEFAAEAGMSQMLYLATEDLNADGVPEIVYSIEEFGAHDSTTFVSIREWDGEEFRPLVVAPSDRSLGTMFRAADMPNLLTVGDMRTYDLGLVPDRRILDLLLPDIDGNGTRELILAGGVGHAETIDGPQRVTVDTWSWNGEAFTLSDSKFLPAEYRFQAVRDGDSAFARGNLEEALTIYRQSLNDEELKGWNSDRLSSIFVTPMPDDPAERPRLAAYAEFRMLLVYAVQGQQPDAQSLFDAMVGEHLQGSPGYPYVQIATRFHDALEAAGSVESACAAAREFAQANGEAILTPLGSQFYGFLYEGYTPESICPVE
jgi:hypothetical protein